MRHRPRAEHPRISSLAGELSVRLHADVAATAVERVDGGVNARPVACLARSLQDRPGHICVLALGHVAAGRRRKRIWPRFADKTTILIADVAPARKRQHRVDRLAALLLAGGGEILAGSAEKLLNLDIWCRCPDSCRAAGSQLRPAGRSSRRRQRELSSRTKGASRLSPYDERDPSPRS